MFNSTATHTPSSTRIDDPFRLRFGSTHRLPRGLREEAAGMSWSLFTATYAPAADIRITGLETTPGRGGKNTYTAELTHLSKTEPPFTESREISAMGAASACTHLLADAGRHVEILAFHQFPIFEATVTVVRLAHQTHDSRTGWAMGFGGTPEASIAAALSSGAQRIHG